MKPDQIAEYARARPRLLDLFCGAGGAAMGYHRAGFDVVGVDIKEQPDYPFEFHQADAMDFPLDGFDVIHASPPCQDHSVSTHQHPSHGTGWMLDATVRRLKDSGLAWVVENVAGPTVEMAGWWFTLCGTMFGLNLRRHRRFGSSSLFLAPPCDHASFPLAISGVGHNEQGHVYRKYAERGLKPPGFAERRAIMEVPWITNREAMAQVVPPAYTEWIGGALIDGTRAMDSTHWADCWKVHEECATSRRALAARPCTCHLCPPGIGCAPCWARETLGEVIDGQA